MRICGMESKSSGGVAFLALADPGIKDQYTPL